MKTRNYKKYEINEVGVKLIEQYRKKAKTKGGVSVSVERLIVFLHDFIKYETGLRKPNEKNEIYIDDFSTNSEKYKEMAGVVTTAELGWMRRMMVNVGVLKKVKDSYSWYNNDRYSYLNNDDGFPRPKTFMLMMTKSKEVDELYETIHWTKLELLRSRQAQRVEKLRMKEKNDEKDVSLYDKDPAINGVLRQARALTREVREYNKSEDDEMSRIIFKLRERVPKRNEPKKRRLSGRAYSPLCSMKKEGDDSREAHLIKTYGTQEIFKYDVKSSIARVAWAMQHEGEWKPDDFDFYEEFNPYPGFFKREVYKEVLTRGAFIHTSNALRMSIDKATYKVGHFWTNMVFYDDKLDPSNPEHQEKIEENLKRIGGYKWIRLCEKWQRLQPRDKKRMSSIIMKEAEKVYGKNRGADVFITESLIYVRLANVLRRKYGVKVKMVYDCFYSDDTRLSHLCQYELPRIARRVYNRFFKKLTLQTA